MFPFSEIKDNVEKEIDWHKSQAGISNAEKFNLSKDYQEGFINGMKQVVTILGNVKIESSNKK